MLKRTKRSRLGNYYIFWNAFSRRRRKIQDPPTNPDFTCGTLLSVYLKIIPLLNLLYREEDAVAQPPAFELPSAGAVWNSPVPPAPRPVKIYEDGSTIAIGRRKRATARVSWSNNSFLRDPEVRKRIDAHVLFATISQYWEIKYIGHGNIYLINAKWRAINNQPLR